MDALAAEGAAAFAGADVAFCTLGTKRRIAGSAEAYVKARGESACLQTSCRQHRYFLEKACLYAVAAAPLVVWYLTASTLQELLMHRSRSMSASVERS